MSGLRDSAGHGTRWAMVDVGGGRMTSLVVFVILARLLEPRAFGLVAMAAVVLALAEVFGNAGLTAAIVQRRDLDDEHLDTAFWTNLAVGAGLTAALWAAAPVAARVFGAAEVAPLVRGLSPVVLLGAAGSVHNALLLREMRFDQLAVRGLVSHLVAGIVAVGLALAGFGVWSLVGQSLVTAFVVMLTLWRTCDWRPRRRFAAGRLRELGPFGAHVIGSRMMHYLMRRGDDFTVGWLLGPVALGYYSVGFQGLSLLSRILIDVPGRVAFPVYSRLQADPDRLRRIYRESSQVLAAAAFPIFAFVAVMAALIVAAILGPRWSPSAPVLALLAVAGIVHTLHTHAGNALAAMGRTGKRAALDAALTVVTLAGVVTAARWGIYAVAAACAAAAWMLLPWPLFHAWRRAGLEDGRSLARFAGPAIAAAATAGVLVAVRGALPELPPLVWLGLAGALGVGVYGGALALLDPRLLRRMRAAARTILTASRPTPVESGRVGRSGSGP